MDRERKAFEEFAREVAPYGVKIIRVSWGREDYPWMEWEWPDGDRGGAWIAQPWAAWQARAALSRAPGEATEAGRAEIRVLRSPDRHDEPASVYVLPGSTEANQPSPWYVCVQVFPDALSVLYFVRRGGVMIDREIPLSELRASVDAAPAEPTEAMVEAGAEAARDDYHGEDGTYQQSLRREWWRSVARACYAAMRAESEGGGVATERAQGEEIRGDGDDHGSRPISPPVVTAASADPRQHRKAPPSVTPPSPGSDLLREVEAFLRAIGGSEYIDTKDAATARELAGELRALLPTPPAQEGGDDA